MKKCKNFISRATFICICAIIMVFFIGCQETPNSMIVVKKGEEAFYEMLTMAGCKVNENDGEMIITANKNTDNELLNPKTAYDAPERLDYTLQIGNTTVEFCAPVYVPEYAIPIVLVSPDKISYSKVKGFIDLIAGDEVLYDYGFASTIRTKKKIQSEIDNCMQAIQNNKNDEMRTNEEKNELESVLEDGLQKLYKDLENAPDSYDDAVKEIEIGRTYTSSGELITEEMTKPIVIDESNFNDTSYFLLVGERAMPCLLNIAATENKFEQQLFYMDMDYMHPKSEEAPDINKLIESVQPYVNLLGNEFTLIDSRLMDEDNFGAGYQLTYKRVLNGVECNHARGQSGGWVAANDPYAFNPPETPRDIYKLPYQQESLIIQVDSEGYVYLIAYSSPLLIEQVLTNDARLLEFDKVKDVLNRYIGLHGFNPDDNVTITITEAKLGLMRIDIPNKDNQYLMVPVWDFYGYYQNNYIYEGMEYEIPPNKKLSYQCYLTINAIDGSIIDRELGY